MQLLDPEAGPADLTVLRDLRVVVVDRDAGRADVLAQELRAGGAIVVVADARTEDLARVEALDPSVIVFDSVALEGPGFDLVRRVRQHPRLRWASLLIANWSELWPDPSMPPDMATLARRVRPLVEQDQELVSMAQRRDAFDTRLEIQGPIRLLRNLLSVGSTLHVTVRNPKALIEIDLAEGLCVGAIGTRPDGPPLEGTQAFAALLALGSGRVHVERRDHPAVANVMSPLDVTVAAALREEVPIKPSHPPPGDMGAVEQVDDDDAAGPLLPVPRESQVDLPRADAAGVTWASMTEERPAFGEHIKTSTDILGRTRALAEASAPGGDLERAAGRKAALLDVQAAEVREAVVEDETIPTMRPPASRTPVREGAATVPRAPAYVPDVLAMREEEARAEGLPLPAVLFEIEEADLTSEPPPVHPPAPPLHSMTMDRPTAPVPVLPELLVESASDAPPPPLAAKPDVFEEPPGPPPPTIIVERRKWPSEPPDAARTRVWPWALAATVGVLLVSGGIGVYLFVMNPAAGSATASAAPQEPAHDPSEPSMGSTPPLAMEARVATAMETATARETPAVETEMGTEPAPVAQREPETETELEPVAETEPATAPESGTGTGAGGSSLPVIDPTRSASSLVREAERYVRDGDFARAGPLFERALELAPNENHALIGVAQVLVHRRENPERAVELAERAVRMRNRRAPYRVILGDALALAGRTREARAEYNRALQIDPGNGDARRGLRALPDD
jgi:CheY-like chemotaxis protein